MPDRRNAIRFEILGRLRGTVSARRPVRLHNISGGGALIQTGWPIERDALVNVSIESGTHLTTLEARVCHVRADFANTSYFIGLQFTALHAVEELARVLPLSVSSNVQPS